MGVRFGGRGRRCLPKRERKAVSVGLRITEHLPHRQRIYFVKKNNYKIIDIFLNFDIII